MKNKRLFSFIIAIIMMLSICAILPLKVSVPFEASASGVDNIAARADYLYNTTWTAQATVNGWRNNYTFSKGSTYHIPYGQPVTKGKYICWGVSVDNFLSATKNASSDFYSTRSYYSGNSGSYSTYYAMDCSALASYCWDLPSRTTTSSWSNLSVTSYGKCTSANVNKIQIGDALNLAGSHIVIVSDVSYDSSGNVTTVEITEQTPPEIKRSYYTASELVSKYSSYTIYRYNKRDGVTPPLVVPNNEIVKPTISTNKSSYIVGDTVNVSWAASPSDSNLSHYWLNVIAPDGTWIYGGTMNKDTSYSFVAKQSGGYSITTYATPIGSKEGEGSLSDTKTITVSEAIPKGKELTSGAGQTLPDGDYYIFSAIDPNYYLDISGRELPASNGTNVSMYTAATNFLPNPYDVWTLQYLGNGFYKIKQKDTNICLDVTGASLDRGTNVQAWTENTSTAQQWSISKTDSGYKIQSRCNSYYLDVNGGTFKTGTNVQIWEGNTSSAQRFCFVPYGPSIGQTIEDGVYTIKSAVDETYGFDVQGYDNTSYQDKTNVQLWKIEDGNDMFNVKYLGNGYYSICESVSDLSLDIYDGYSAEYMNGSKNVQMYTYSGDRNQKWVIRDAGNGYYNIISASSGYCIDLSGGVAEPRRNIAQFIYNTSNAQKWKFEAPVPAPDYSKLTADKTTALAGESITFTAEADNAANYTIVIDKDGEQLITPAMPDGQLSLAFSEVGTYSAYVTASNRSGSVNSQKITFEVNTDITLYDSEKYTLPFSSDYTFKTNNSNVAVVSKSGVLTAIGAGKATISVIDADANVIQITVNVLSETITGDCNRDGEFNVSDVVLLQQWLLAVPNIRIADWKSADLCEDGKLDVFDLCLMKKMLINQGK